MNRITYILMFLVFLAAGCLTPNVKQMPGNSVQMEDAATVTSVAFSPDGRYALSGSWDKTMKLWEVSNGREIRTFQGHSWTVTSVAFSPDGSYALSGSGDNTMKLWEVSSGREIRTFQGS